MKLFAELARDTWAPEYLQASNIDKWQRGQLAYEKLTALGYTLKDGNRTLTSQDRTALKKIYELQNEGLLTTPNFTPEEYMTTAFKQRGITVTPPQTTHASGVSTTSTNQGHSL